MRVAKIVLSKLTKGSFRRRDLVKGVLAESPSYDVFQSTLKWLVRRGYVERVARGIYCITKEGENFLRAI
ncbi:MAG: type IV toxin-antitoxin system AbiEi family antitoxin domain-containing protein [Candidatus Heimdallarchaeota archaeon]